MSIPTQSLGSYDTVPQEDRTLGMVAYVLAILTSWIGPLVLWLVKKDQSKFVAYHCIQSLLLMGAVFVAAVIANIALSILHLGLVAGLVGLVLWVGALVLNVQGALAASKGDWYDMPVVGPYARKFAGL